MGQAVETAATAADREVGEGVWDVRGGARRKGVVGQEGWPWPGSGRGTKPGERLPVGVALLRLSDALYGAECLSLNRLRPAAIAPARGDGQALARRLRLESGR